MGDFPKFFWPHSSSGQTQIPLFNPLLTRHKLAPPPSQNAGPKISAPVRPDDDPKNTRTHHYITCVRVRLRRASVSTVTGYSFQLDMLAQTARIIPIGTHASFTRNASYSWSTCEGMRSNKRKSNDGSAREKSGSESCKCDVSAKCGSSGREMRGAARLRVHTLNISHKLRPGARPFSSVRNRF